MKTSKTNFSRLIFLFSLQILVAQSAFSISQSIGSLVQNGLLRVEIKSTGAHAESCVEFRVKNMTGDSLYGFLEPGRRLTSNDPGEQDIFIVREEAFALAKNETKTFFGYGFCCQSNNRSPQKDAGFGLGGMTNDNWQALARQINASNYPPDAIQNAIWVVSDGHDIRSIPALAEGKTEELRQFVAKQLGITVPWYSFLYAEDSTRLYSGIANRLFADVTFRVPRRSMITGVIYDQKGNQIYDSPSYYVSDGEHHFQLNVPLDYFPQGDYTFQLIEDFDVMNLERKFHLGQAG